MLLKSWAVTVAVGMTIKETPHSEIAMGCGFIKWGYNCSISNRGLIRYNNPAISLGLPLFE